MSANKVSVFFCEKKTYFLAVGNLKTMQAFN
jgi:hypothetical protein